MPSSDDNWEEEFISFEFDKPLNGNTDLATNSDSFNNVDLHYNDQDGSIYLALDGNVYLGKPEEFIGTNIILNVKKLTSHLDKNGKSINTNGTTDESNNDETQVELSYHSHSSKLIKSIKTKVVAMESKCPSKQLKDA